MEAVECKTQEEWDFVSKTLEYKWTDARWDNRKDKSAINLTTKEKYGSIDYYKRKNYKIYTFDEYLIKNNLKTNKEKEMKEIMLDVLNKTYHNSILRETTVPLFMSNPGIGKSSIVAEFAKNLGVNMVKTTLSQRMPNEVIGAMMPNANNKTWEVYDNAELLNLKDGDIWFIDEVFNGTMKQTLDALLNFLQDRRLLSGKKFAKVMVVAASNPQGLINLTPQIKGRFRRYDLKFNSLEYQNYLEDKYGMPHNISKHLCTLISKETFEDSNVFNYKTPRSIEQSIQEIGCGLETELADQLNTTVLAYLKEKIKLPAINDKPEEEVEYVELLRKIVKFQNQFPDVEIPTTAPEEKKQKPTRKKKENATIN
jgi:hypothetical protein